jgi:hypothetical protein
MFDAEDEVLAPDEVAEFKQAALAQEEKGRYCQAP